MQTRNTNKLKISLSQIKIRYKIYCFCKNVNKTKFWKTPKKEKKVCSAGGTPNSVTPFLQMNRIRKI
jgi:hypothetical protein